jgi:hypothetical protein
MNIWNWWLKIRYGKKYDILPDCDECINVESGRGICWLKKCNFKLKIKFLQSWLYEAGQVCPNKNYKLRRNINMEINRHEVTINIDSSNAEDIRMLTETLAELLAVIVVMNKPAQQIEQIRLLKFIRDYFNQLVRK